eukprot:6195492-Pleurochrysis_carterae.AAC.4
MIRQCRQNFILQIAGDHSIISLRFVSQLLAEYAQCLGCRPAARADGQHLDDGSSLPRTP